MSMQKPEQQSNSRVEMLHKLVVQLSEDLDEEREERKELEQRVTAEEERGEGRDKKISELYKRTDMLQLVEEADNLTAEQRRATLVQHLHRKATRRGEKGRAAKAELDQNAAEEALHHPDIDRTAYYHDMAKAAKEIDGSVLQYDDGVLRMNLEVSDVPERLKNTE